MALEYIIPVFNDLNNEGIKLYSNFRKTATQDCIELIYYAYLRKIIPFEISPSKKNIKLLAENFELLDIILDHETFRTIVFEQFENDMKRKNMLEIVEIFQEYYDDERLEFDITDGDFLLQLNLFDELENKRIEYFKIKDKYEKALSIIINNYEKRNRLSRTLKRL